MVIIEKINKNNIDNQIIYSAIDHLQSGGVLIYPTDTCYGIGVIWDNQKAVANVNLLKDRTPDKKYSVIIPNIKWAKDNLEVDSNQEQILRQYLPGPFTFILKIQNSDKTLGIRIPDYPFMQMLVEKLNQPITTTSANTSGQKDVHDFNDLQHDILKRSSLINNDILVLNGGELAHGSRSTVVDIIKNPPEVIRQGSGMFGSSH